MPLFDHSPSLWAGLALCGFVVSQTALGLVGGWRRRRNSVKSRAAQKRAFTDRIALLSRSAQAAQIKFAAWEGIRTMRVAAIVDETEHVRSYYLAPLDGKPLPPYEPGQYLTLHLPVAGAERPLVRCYSLSDRPREDYYRVTIKRCRQPNGAPGAVSNYLHDKINLGATLDVAAPRGAFFLRPEGQSPVVLVAGGIGITPVLSMLNAMVRRGLSHEVYLFLGMRNGREHPFKEHLEQLAAQHPQLRLLVSYSKPTSADQPYRDFQHVGRVTIDHLREVLPTNRFDYYLCGPGGMLQDLICGLEAWGVPQERIHFEAFGPATVQRTTAPRHAASVGSTVVFSRSKKEQRWDVGVASLLELGEAAGVKMASGCRAGNCGECLVRVVSGKIAAHREPGFPLPEGHCLACISVPTGAVTLDA